MKTIQVQQLFNIIPGEFSKFPDKKEPTDPDDIPVIGAGTDFSRIVGGYVNRKKCKRVFPANSLYITTDGVYCGSTFIYPFEFAGNIAMAILEPKVPMTLRQKMYYATAIAANRKFFSYGRKMKGMRLATIEVPDISEIPAWIETVELSDLNVGKAKSKKEVVLPPVSEWKEFKFPELFDVQRGKGRTLRDAKNHKGNTPYIGSSEINNGITCWCDFEPTYPGKVLTIATSGSVGATFYQEQSFCSGPNIAIISLRNKEMNLPVGLFLSTCFNQQRKFYSYGRVLGIRRIQELTLTLPVTSEGQPDYDLMERYINSLPYSDCL